METLAFSVLVPRVSKTLLEGEGGAEPCHARSCAALRAAARGALYRGRPLPPLEVRLPEP